MKSTLLNMTAVLFGITLVASAGVGYVNLITEKPIEEKKQEATDNAIGQVLTGIDFDQLAPADTMLNVKNNAVIVYRAMKGDQVAGYAVKAPSLTVDGFNGKVILMVGYTLDGIVNEVSVVEENETPGLGTNMEKPDNNLYKGVIGKNTWEQRQQGLLKVKKDGGEVDALTAATYSSKAYLNAVETANAAFRLAQEKDQPAVAAEAPEAAEAEADAETAAEAVAETANNEPEAQEGGQNE